MLVVCAGVATNRVGCARVAQPETPARFRSGQEPLSRWGVRAHLDRSTTPRVPGSRHSACRWADRVPGGRAGRRRAAAAKTLITEQGRRLVLQWLEEPVRHLRETRALLCWSRPSSTSSASIRSRSSNPSLCLKDFEAGLKAQLACGVGWQRAHGFRLSRGNGQSPETVPRPERGGSSRPVSGAGLTRTKLSD